MLFRNIPSVISLRNDLHAIPTKITVLKKTLSFPSLENAIDERGVPIRPFSLPNSEMFLFSADDPLYWINNGYVP